MKKLVIVLSVILALMLSYLTVRHFVRASADAEALLAAAAAAPEPEPEPEPEAAPAAEPEPEPEPEPPVELDDEAVQAEIERISEKYYATGTQVAVINNGEVIGTYACGWATIGTDPMTTEHKIRVASVSKVIAAMAAMLLHEDGVVDLDGDIGRYWDLETAASADPDRPVTIRTILAHTSTIPSYSDYYSVSAGTIRSRLSYGTGGARPGDLSCWCYNNYAFSVLGATLERAADQTLNEILEEKLFAPLDIDAAFAGGDLADPSLVAALYRGSSVELSSWTQQSMRLNDTPGENSGYYAGGLTISAGDLAKLIALLAGDGEYDGKRLMKDTSVAQMEAHYRLPLDDGTYQAHPLIYVPDIYGREGVYYHPGTAYGALTCVSYDPKTGDGVVVLTTGASGGAERYEFYSVCDEINEYLYELVG